jgi:hypothetical protein
MDLTVRGWNWQKDNGGGTFAADCDSDDIPGLLETNPPIVTSSRKNKYFFLGVR